MPLCLNGRKQIKYLSLFHEKYHFHMPFARDLFKIFKLQIQLQEESLNLKCLKRSHFHYITNTILKL
jgi:hypothetical protein